MNVASWRRPYFSSVRASRCPYAAINRPTFPSSRTARCPTEVCWGILASLMFCLRARRGLLIRSFSGLFMSPSSSPPVAQKMPMQFVSNIVLTLVVFASAVLVGARDPDSTFLSTCKAIGKAISNASDVYYPASAEYINDNSHYAASSSAVSACSVEPGTPTDVGRILRILGSSRTPFAVKGGGHSTNPGFSSTNGVQISMIRFSTIVVHASKHTVDVGTGLIWDDVYAALDKKGVNVVGGRTPGVGVAGLTLGGGYSWKSSQFGLGVDNVAAFELVLPNGRVTVVTEADVDLWFGLRGGFNNFGIVTKLTLKSHPQTDVWGGLIAISSDYMAEYNEAIVKFSEVTDNKAAMVSSCLFQGGSPVVLGVILFYDSPKPPGRIFDSFSAIPYLSRDIKTRSFLSFYKSVLGDPHLADTSTFYDGIPLVGSSLSLLNSIIEEVTHWAHHITVLDSSSSVMFSTEPFDAALLTHGTRSAYPPDRSRLFFPNNLSFSWTNSSVERSVYETIRRAKQGILAAAVAEGQNLTGATTYPNYALYDTPLEDMYGDNVRHLRAIKRKYDPHNVMGLAGGFKF